jgi:succinate dehydrogenase / fumarate reductase cytochrome b subunit
MAQLAAVLGSSIAKKYTMALSGLFLIVFLLEHLYTNLLLYAGDGGLKFNEASHEMTSSLFIRIVEVVLFAAIIMHVFQATVLTRENAKARPVKYAVSGVSETSNWFSRNMGLTGSLILFFIVVHLYNFFLPYRITGEVGDGQALTLAQCVVAALRNPVYAGLYLVSVVFLGFHLNHGFQSAFQTLGFNNKTYAPLLKMAGTGLALLFTLGYGSFPILIYSGVCGIDVLPLPL